MLSVYIWDTSWHITSIMRRYYHHMSLFLSYNNIQIILKIIKINWYVKFMHTVHVFIYLAYLNIPIHAMTQLLFLLVKNPLTPSISFPDNSNQRGWTIPQIKMHLVYQKIKEFSKYFSKAWYRIIELN